jgi:hypothetical protein
MVLPAVSVLAQSPGHLLITEFCVTPTPGEFIEIHNPTDSPIDLSDYYITDATFSGGGAFYYNVVLGLPDTSGGGGFGDFNARFPVERFIMPGEFQTIALIGDSLFFETYGVLPTYELYEDSTDFDDDVSNMVEAAPGSIDDNHTANVQFGVLSNAGEILILYHWDGESDLVQDVDYTVWGDKVEGVDKTGVSIDGPDVDSDASTYATDTPIVDQRVVNADNDGDENPHDNNLTAQRRVDFEDIEVWTGGNGIGGHDETSEDVSWKGGIWSINEAATPNRRSLTPYPPADSLTIADLNFVRFDDIGPAGNDNSPFDGDTLSVTGVFMQGPRDIFLGGRWGGFMQDERGGPWSGFFIIQNDSSIGGTLLSSALPGDKIRVTGIVSEFPIGPDIASITQFVLLTDPVTPVEFLDFGLPLPDPIVLTPGDLGFVGGNSADVQLSERWEGVLARFENITVLANGLPGNTMNVGDETGTIVLDDYFNAISIAVNNNGNVWPGFPAGTRINVNGFIRGASSTGLITVNPRNFDDLEIAAAPPEISNVLRDPAAPTSSQEAVVSATIVSSTSTVASASVNYSVDNGDFQTVAMTANGDSYSGSIPAQSDGAFVQYFITATDAVGESTIAPGDTSAAKFFYNVRDAGLTIRDLQFTPFSSGNSGYAGLEVTVTGVATTDSSDFSFYYVQDGTDPWSGIAVSDNVNNVKLGDNVTITGTVREQFNETQLFSVSSVLVNSTGNTVPGPILKTTGELSSLSTGEQWEGMLMRIENLTVTNPFADGASNFGEFVVDDGSGGFRIDDLSAEFRGNLDTAYVQDQEIASITGIQYFSFSNYKLQPRNNADVMVDPVSVEDENLPLVFRLNQNYPNPFNPETVIQYAIAKPTEVKIEIFNIRGQKVRTLVNELQPAGTYNAVWRGVNEAGLPVATGVYVYRMRAGEFVSVKKMLFLK